MLEQGRRPASLTLRVTAWTFVALLTCIVVGSAVARTEIVARGTGKVIPVGRTQTIQPQFAGKVKAILVSQGDIVAPGQLLVQLDRTAVRSEVERLDVQLEQQMRRRRLADTIVKAMTRADPASPAFLELGEDIYGEVAATDATRDENGLTLAISELATLQARVAEIDAEIARIERAISTHAARVGKVEAEMSLTAERNAAVGELLQRGTISRVEYLDRRRETETARNDLAIARMMAEEQNAELAKSRQQRRSTIAEALNANRNALAAADTNIASLRAELEAARGRLQNADIVAQIGGHVDDLRIHTLGGYVDEGQPLMSIVPTDGGIEIEAFFENRDAGFLSKGQQAIVRLDAFPAERFGTIAGTVTSISADARRIEDRDTGLVYAARVAPGRERIESGGASFPIIPGMTATVDVVTGRRRLISYFFEPIVKAVQDGMRER